MVKLKHTRTNYSSNANDNWERSKEEFLKWITECGIMEDDKTYIDLDFLINDPTDIQDWIGYFDGDIERIVVATESYKQWMIESCKVLKSG